MLLILIIWLYFYFMKILMLQYFALGLVTSLTMSDIESIDRDIDISFSENFLSKVLTNL